MMNYYLIDVGSSTIKVYMRINKNVTLVEQKTFSFKDGFLIEKNLSENNKTELYDYFNLLIERYKLNNKNSKIFATGIFRDILCKQSFIKEFFDKTGLYFNIISQDLEAFYLEKAWINNSNVDVKNIIVINIGGKTTEILMYEYGKLVGSPIKLSLGVSTIIKNYPELNNKFSAYPLERVVEDIFNDVKNEIDCDVFFDTAVYTGGELTYMSCAHYPLVENTIFKDEYHKYMINIADYEKRNKEIFSVVEYDELKNMMPQNPEWMSGARACSAIAQAIFKLFNVKYVIPSDSNLINGVNIQETRNVVVCGSFNKYLKEITNLILMLKSKNITVLSPKSTDIVGNLDGFVLFENDVITNHNTWSIEELHLKAIDNCDVVIACNYNNYIGVSTSFELDYAYRKGKKIIFIEDNDVSIKFGERFGINKMPCEIGMLI